MLKTRWKLELGGVLPEKAVEMVLIIHTQVWGIGSCLANPRKGAAPEAFFVSDDKKMKKAEG